MSIEISTIRGAEALAALEPEWSALCDTTDATVFQRPEWLLPFADLFEGTPLALVVRAGPRLVGVVPLSHHRTAAGKEVRLLGTGLADVLDAVADETYAGDVREAVAAWVQGALARGCVIDWQQLPHGSLLLDVPSFDQFVDHTRPHEPCPTLALDPMERSGRLPIPHKMRDKLRYYTNRARNAGRLEFETATRDTYPVLLDAVCRLHERRWTDEGGGVLRDARVGELNRRVARALVARDRLALHVVRLNDAIIAGTFGFRDRTRVYLYLTGMDPAFQELSPGTLSIGRMVECAQRNGALSVEFLRGREPYKYFWGVTDRPTYRRQFLPRLSSTA